SVEAGRAGAGRAHAGGARLTALSPALVLAGARAARKENVPAVPVLTCGLTRLHGETAVLAEAPDSAVLRVALVLGRGFGPRTTASEGIAAALAAGRPLRLFTDQFRTPIDPESVADAVRRLIERPV